MRDLATKATNVNPHIQAINALVDKLAHANRKVEEYQIAIGQHIKAIRLAEPNNWESIVKTECRLGRTRSYELMAIADGKSVEQARADTARRVREHAARKREARPLANGRRELVAAQNRLATTCAAYETQIDRFKIELAELKDQKALRAELHAQRAALEDIDRLAGEVRALNTHPEHNRDAITEKINQLKTSPRAR